MRLSTPEILQRHGTGLGFPWQASEAAWMDHGVHGSQSRLWEKLADPAEDKSGQTGADGGAGGTAALCP